MRENKLLWYVACAIVCWALWASVFDRSGNFDPVWDFDVIEYRVGSRLGVIAQDANRTIEEQNHGMQKVVNGRAKRVKSRVNESKGE